MASRSVLGVLFHGLEREGKQNLEEVGREAGAEQAL
jgi:hypothetical protein